MAGIATVMRENGCIPKFTLLGSGNLTPVWTLFYEMHLFFIYRMRYTQRAPIGWFTPQMPTQTRVGLGQSQNLEYNPCLPQGHYNPFPEAIPNAF